MTLVFFAFGSGGLDRGDPKTIPQDCLLIPRVGDGDNTFNLSNASGDFTTAGNSKGRSPLVDEVPGLDRSDVGSSIVLLLSI